MCVVHVEVVTSVNSGGNARGGEALDWGLLWNINRQSNGLDLKTGWGGGGACFSARSEPNTNTHLIIPTAIL